MSIPQTKIKDKVQVFFIWFILPLVSGLLFSFYFVWKKTYVISLNLDISNIATILIAVMFSSYVVRKLTLNDQRSKIKFEYLTNLITSFEDDFNRKIKIITEEEKASIKKLPSLLKNHGTRVSKLKELAIKHNYLQRGDLLIKKITKNFIELRKLMDTPSNTITPTEEYFNYSEDTLMKIDEKMVERQLLIFELTILMSNK